VSLEFLNYFSIPVFDDEIRVKNKQNNYDAAKESRAVEIPVGRYLPYGYLWTPREITKT